MSRTLQTYNHNSGNLNIQRNSIDQTALVTVNANINGYTNNLQEGDLLWVTLKGNDGNSNYTANLTGILDFTDLISTGGSGSALPIVYVYPDSVVSVLLRNIDGVVYGNLDVVTVGTPGGGSQTVTPPSESQNASVSPGDGVLDVSWSTPASNGGAAITNYQVRSRVSGGSWVNSGNLGTSLSHQLTGLINNSSYDVQVRAVNSAGPGSWSNIVSGTPVGSGGSSGPIGYVRDSFSSGSATTNGTLSVSLPQSSVGNLLVMTIDAAGNNNSLGTPSGWTRLTTIDPGTSLYFHTVVFVKEAQASDSNGSVNVSNSGYQAGWGAIVSVVENADTSNLNYDIASIANTGWSRNVTVPALTTSNNDLVLRGGSHDNSTLTLSGCTSERSEIPYNGLSVFTDNDNSTQQITGSHGGGYSMVFTLAIPEA